MLYKREKSYYRIFKKKIEKEERKTQVVIEYLKEKLEKEEKKLQVLECDLEKVELFNINKE